MSDRRDDNGELLIPPAPAAAEPREIPPPDNNVMMHRYRELDATQMQQMRDIKDTALQLWNDLHVIDGTSADHLAFDSFALQQAGARLEESMLWVEKHFLT